MLVRLGTALLGLGLGSDSGLVCSSPLLKVSSFYINRTEVETKEDVLNVGKLILLPI